VSKRREGWDALSQHTRKEIKDVLRELKDAGGWSLWWPEGHWGKLRCDGDGAGRGCYVDVPGTPKNASRAALQIWRTVQRCPHGHAP
jgi:hypothetical protein